RCDNALNSAHRYMIAQEQQQEHIQPISILNRLRLLPALAAPDRRDDLANVLLHPFTFLFGGQVGGTIIRPPIFSSVVSVSVALGRPAINSRHELPCVVISIMSRVTSNVLVTSLVCGIGSGPPHDAQEPDANGCVRLQYSQVVVVPTAPTRTLEGSGVIRPMF